MNTTGPTRILLADDHALVRRGVRLILESEPDLTVVAEAGDGAEAVSLARTHEIDLAILDHRAAFVDDAQVELALVPGIADGDADRDDHGRCGRFCCRMADGGRLPRAEAHGLRQ